LIADLPTIENIGYVFIDEFHILSDEIQHRLADYMKVLADEERCNDKIILFGVYEACDFLFRTAPDLIGRIDVIKLD